VQHQMLHYLQLLEQKLRKAPLHCGRMQVKEEGHERRPAVHTTLVDGCQRLGIKLRQKSRWHGQVDAVEHHLTLYVEWHAVAAYVLKPLHTPCAASLLIGLITIHKINKLADHEWRGRPARQHHIQYIVARCLVNNLHPAPLVLGAHR